MRLHGSLMIAGQEVYNVRICIYTTDHIDIYDILF